MSYLTKLIKDRLAVLSDRIPSLTNYLLEERNYLTELEAEQTYLRKNLADLECEES